MGFNQTSTKNLQQQQQQNAVPKGGKNVNIYIFGFIQIWSVHRGKEVVEDCFLAESAAIFGLDLQIKNACRTGVYWPSKLLFFVYSNFA